MFKSLHLDAPNIGVFEKRYLSLAVDSGFVSTVGPFVTKFEKNMAAYLQAKSATALQSGTAAIHLSLYTLGLGPGDEVIVPSLTFAATVNPILYVGATPVIVDVDARTWNIDPAQIEKAITRWTKAIVAVHLYGNPCAMDEIMKIAQKYGLYVIEDATESLGAQFKGKHTGTIGHFGCFSFNGNKVITTGGGGMIVGRRHVQLDHIRYLANQSKDNVRQGFHSEIGFNYRMTNIEAALGLAQMKRLGMFVARKKTFRKIYEKAFKGLSGVSFQETQADAKGSFWFTAIRLNKNVNIPKFMQALQKKGIPSRRIFVPLNRMPYLKAYSKDHIHARDIYNSGLCLPSSTMNDEKDIEQAAQIIREAYGKV